MSLDIYHIWTVKSLELAQAVGVRREGESLKFVIFSPGTWKEETVGTVVIVSSIKLSLSPSIAYSSNNLAHKCLKLLRLLTLTLTKNLQGDEELTAISFPLTKEDATGLPTDPAYC